MEITPEAVLKEVLSFLNDPATVNGQLIPENLLLRGIPVDHESEEL